MSDDTIPGPSMTECWACLGDGRVHHQGIPIACPVCVPDARERSAINLDLRRQFVAEDRAARARGLVECHGERR